MPEAATIEAPITESQSVSGPSAISQFTSEMAASVAKATAPKAETPAETPAETETETPPTETPDETEAKPAEKPAEKTAPKEKPMSEWTEKDFDAAMKKSPAKAWKVYEYSKNKYEARIKEFEGKIKALESKPVESPGDAKRIEAYEKQIKELGEKAGEYLKTIAELDYSRSPEFKKQYTERLTSAYQAAVEEIKQLSVSENDTTRPATQQDFDLLLRLPVREQIARAKQMFGDAADAFFSHRNEIQRLQREGREALTRVQEEAESRRTQSEARSKEEQRLYDSTVEAELKDLSSNMPEYFGDTDNQEAAEAYKKGMELTKRILADRNSMSPQERASHDALLQATHAGFRRMVVENKALQTERDALKAELEKYRKTDPGAAGGSKTAKAGGDDEIGGIDAMASKFQRAA